MTHIRNTVAAAVIAAALSLVAACGEMEAPAQNINDSDNKKSEKPAPKGPVRTGPGRLDFGEGKVTLPAKPKPSSDANASRLDFGDNGRP